jgi:hypothetical protein
MCFATTSSTQEESCRNKQPKQSNPSKATQAKQKDKAQNRPTHEADLAWFQAVCQSYWPFGRSINQIAKLPN